MDDKIEMVPSLRNGVENRFHLARDIDVERHQKRGFDHLGQRLDIFPRLVVQIGDGDLGAQRAKRLGAAPGNGILIGDADNQAFFSFQQSCLDGRKGAVRPPRYFMLFSGAHNIISGTSWGTTITAWVFSMICDTGTPGALSSKTGWPSRNAITANSVTTRSTGR